MVLSLDEKNYSSICAHSDVSELFTELVLWTGSRTTRVVVAVDEHWQAVGEAARRGRLLLNTAIVCHWHFSDFDGFASQLTFQT